MKKKIIFYAYDLEIGGIETSLYNLLNKLVKKDYDITLVLEEKKGTFLDTLDKNITVLEYRISKSKNVLFRKIINFFKRLMWTLKHKDKYDFACCYATYSIPGAVLSLISSKNTCYYIHSNYQNIYDDEEYKKFFEQRMVRNFKNIVFVSSQACEYFNKVYPELKERTHVIGNVIDNDKIINDSLEEVEFIKDKDEKLFVFVGRLDDEAKRLSRGIHLIDYLNKKGVKSRLLIVGDGPSRKKYEEEINSLNSDQFILVGAKKNPYPYMRMADYIILTSQYEGFPVIYWESVTLNKKIITTIESSDGFLNVPKDYGLLVSKDEKNMFEEVLEHIKKDDFKDKKIDVNVANLEKVEKLERIING